MAPYRHDVVSMNVGERLHKLREVHNISMRALAARSGLSANALSMIERGRVSPSVSTLYKLANALGISITSFFDSEMEKKHVIFLKSAERTQASFARGVFEGLGGDQFVGKVEPFLLTLEGSANSGPRSIAHTGYEFILCLRGELEYQVERQIFRLSAGDSLLFTGQLKHRWKNPGEKAVSALVLISCFEDGEQPCSMHWKKGTRKQT